MCEFMLTPFDAEIKISWKDDDEIGLLYHTKQTCSLTFRKKNIKKIWIRR